MPLLITEAAGRRVVPLKGLPSGVVALTVPRKGPEGPRVPRDRRGRVAPRQVDLVTEDAVPPFQPPIGFPSGDLIWLLRIEGQKQWATVTKRLGKTAWEIVVALLRSGGVVVRCEVTSELGYKPLRLRLSAAWAAVAADQLRQLTDQPDPYAARQALLERMADVPQMADERALLAAMPENDDLDVPPGSRSGAKRWSLYDHAIRAACTWFSRYAGTDQVDATELAAVAFQESHTKWTPPLRAAFANLVGMSWDSAVLPIDTEVTLRGPLRWTIGEVVADAATSVPWIGLPSNGLCTLGVVESRARGVLLIENKSNFERVCAIPEIVDRWLCVWGRGYARDGLVTLVRALAPEHVAAWGDLDAHGIAIVADLAERLERSVVPVGMDPEIFRTGVKRKRTDEERRDARELAEKMATSAPEPLRPLAELIAMSGDSCEQETTRQRVVPQLPRMLRAIENGDLVRCP
ncbi:Wadjet anti-phage system protein JetD domain-containing protein [Actinoplanes teichomyceticus]|uniref:Wadjet anti-phage system protein JetD domain-containing protein n=1 Tax=Actinoplanes teichomyceticus TaxID=1867 RepID=UPI001EF234A6|nr:Wadjet anti-phage system protein JetD domain-containing protein [Actinoplanes teichomyceticus]